MVERTEALAGEKAAVLGMAENERPQVKRQGMALEVAEKRAKVVEGVQRVGLGVRAQMKMAVEAEAADEREADMALEAAGRRQLPGRR